MVSLYQLLQKAKDVTDNSKEVRDGSIFFAIRGTKTDGHNFVGEVLKKKPLAVVVEEDLNTESLNTSVPILKVKNTRKAFAEACRIFYRYPDRELKVFGITGTNGKTSTSYIIASLLNALGVRSGVIGTIEYRYADKVYGKGWTTPHPKVWFKTLRQMATDGASAVCAEISSHALDQYRVWGTEFEGVIFTNLTRDHLDYHRTLEDYFNAKRSLFSEYTYRVATVCGDDPFGFKLKEEFNLISFGFKEHNEYRISEAEVSLTGSKFKLQTPEGVFEINSPLAGEFQIYNLAGALALLNLSGFPMEELTAAVPQIGQIPGRFEVVVREPFTVIVDYAHTPDALEKLLGSVRKVSKGRVITVFGAGGNRDRTKRPLMGAAAERYSDLVVITSDNPRFEEPTKIIEDILNGIKDTSKVLIEPDRRSAIHLALKMAKEGDTVVIAGKGHEDYQEIKGERFPFSDREEVLKFLEG